MSKIMNPLIADRLIGEIFSALRWCEEADKGLQYWGDTVELMQETSSYAFRRGLELAWICDERDLRNLEDFEADIVRIAIEFDNARYATVALSKNTNSYYLFMYPSGHIYHFARSDIVNYYYTRDKNYILGILEEERMLIHGNEEGFTKLIETEFILFLDEELAKEVTEELRNKGEKPITWFNVQMRYLTRQKPLTNCVYVVARFRGAHNIELEAWRRVELSSLCMGKYSLSEISRCYESLATQFIKP
jgi:hypothetical protein